MALALSSLVPPAQETLRHSPMLHPHTASMAGAGIMGGSHPEPAESAMNQNVSRVPLLIDGAFVQSRSEEWRDIVNPATQEVIAQVPFATGAEVDAAVAAAKEAFKTWRNTPTGIRARLLRKY